METDGITGGLDDADVDLSDETQDFRFLAAITKKGDGSIPKRGEKDFEPDGTNLQSNALEDSRAAMFKALSVDRSHTGKNRVTATWRPSRSLAEVHEQRGVLFKSMGRADRTGTIWLLPEELIYMVERGSLECFYEEGIPMSLQAVYAAAIKATGGLERYQVYANLRRSGYAVFRDPDRQHDDLFKAVHYPYKAVKRPISKPVETTRSWNLGIFGSLFRSIFYGNSSKGPFGPLVPKGTYRSYKEIYSRLLIPAKVLPSTEKGKDDPYFNITFHVWKPQPQFKKSNPGPPDFYISVVSVNETKVPSLTQIDALFEGIPKTDDSSKSLYQKLKDGRKSVILAIVDYGVISYLRLSDSRFAEHPLDVDPPPLSGKGKGKGSKGGAAKKK
ncbi:hypothetical protein ABW19_dt0200216 [Dactylella cylindrospora]|nr:hypothetical protein ABW19_dt0200216 [Dactylella cylindrospora]